MSKRVQFTDYEVGDTIPELQTGPITQTDLVRYSGASGDFNPIHTDPEFAKKAGLKGSIAHGMYVMAQLGRLLTNWVHPAQIRFFGVKFTDMIFPGESLDCSGKVKRKQENDGERLLMISIQVTVSGNARAVGSAVVSCD